MAGAVHGSELPAPVLLVGSFAVARLGSLLCRGLLLVLLLRVPARELRSALRLAALVRLVQVHKTIEEDQVVADVRDAPPDP
jgi:hypothetical protein